ncbi:hypothetical protein IC620_08640 [Hazenella sp. IB182357]|uniref:Uncharacterized protein n=1 Tax=Polycladospora coralii TaxID=2771432 RepID=A0A926N644_9BACL|nr:hypothetical protein [Polycladospora coralii]MBD1372424.1 hypothetical protein [Polycladospora coralii]
MSIIRNVLSIYKIYFTKIMLIILIYTLPIGIIGSFISNFCFVYFDGLGYTSIGIMFATFAQIVMLVIMQVPLIFMVLRYEINGEPASFSTIMKLTADKLFPIYVMAIIYVIFIAFGTIFLFLPGLIVYFLLFLFPFVAVINNQLWWRGFKRTIAIGANNILKIICIILVYGGVQWILELLVQDFNFIFIDRFIFEIAIQTVVGGFLLPIFVFAMSLYYMKWTDFDAELDY